MKKISVAFLMTFLTLPIFSQTKDKIQIKASQAEYYEYIGKKGHEASPDGVYPVKITVYTETEEKTLYIKIYRSTQQDGPFELIIDAMQPNEEYFDLYDANPAQPGQKFYYKAVMGKNTNTVESNVSCGWGALTHEYFFVFYNQNITKSYTKLPILQTKNALQKLGEQTAKGNYSGTLDYEAKVQGIGGIASMKYTNYSDDPLFVLDGNMITNANMLSNGTMDGYMNISGMYEGTIYYSDVIIKNGQSAGGTYGVEPKGTARKNIDYKWIFVGVN